MSVVAEPEPGADLLDAYIDAGLVPSCAMDVKRTTDLGPLSAYVPPVMCGCHFEARLGIARGETTDDGRVTLQAVECLCACEAAPMAQVDDRYEMQLTPEKIDRILDGLR